MCLETDLVIRNQIRPWTIISYTLITCASAKKFLSGKSGHEISRQLFFNWIIRRWSVMPHDFAHSYKTHAKIYSLNGPEKLQENTVCMWCDSFRVVFFSEQNPSLFFMQISFGFFLSNTLTLGWRSQCNFDIRAHRQTFRAS